MAFEVISKKETKRKSWLDLVFYFCLILLIISVLSYFVLEYSLKQAEEELKDLNNRISEQQNEENKKLKEKLFFNQKKIDEFSIILNEHKLTSQVFSFIENLTHPEVVFLDFSFSSNNSILSLSARTSNFKALGEQLLILQGQENIENIELSNISLMEEGNIDFSLGISLNPKVFTKK
ncbi:hypothetical protein KAU51_03460 [Candidatus Parcubacteria bacterium]|nr:hypothetical protein [Candidatus Parcubacteria bacterium]